MKRSSAILFPLLLSILILLPTVLAVALPAKAYSYEFLDQVNDPLPATMWRYSSLDAFQSFTPTLPSLTAVDIRLKNSNSTHTLSFTVKIRQGKWNGTVLGSQTAVVPYSFGNGTLLHVEFLPIIILMPSATYVIEVDFPKSYDMYGMANVWWAMRDDDPYPGGMQIESGEPIPTDDFSFRTWGTFSVGGEVIPTAAGNYASLLVATTAASVIVVGYGLAKRKPAALFSSE